MRSVRPLGELTLVQVGVRVKDEKCCNDGTPMSAEGVTLREAVWLRKGKGGRLRFGRPCASRRARCRGPARGCAAVATLLATSRLLSGLLSGLLFGFPPSIDPPMAWWARSSRPLNPSLAKLPVSRDLSARNPPEARLSRPVIRGNQGGFRPSTTRWEAWRHVRHFHRRTPVFRP